MIWTAISYNWSAGMTSFNVFYGQYSHHEAAAKFKKEFPGENLLALITGDHRSSTYTYPLLLPYMTDVTTTQDKIEETDK